MGNANQTLNEFVTFLGSPDMYGSMSSAQFMLKWLVHLVVTVTMIVAVLAILVVMFKVAVDILMLTGVGKLVTSKAQESKGFAAKASKGLEGFASESAMLGTGAWDYIKGDFWKIAVTLGMIGVLASGAMLPIAAQVAGATGVLVDRMIGLDPASRIADFDFEEFQTRVDFQRPEALKSDYDSAVSRMETLADQIYDVGGSVEDVNDPRLENLRHQYTFELAKATQIAGEMRSRSGEVNVPESHFDRHTRSSVCVENFVAQDMLPDGASASCVGVSN